jgi:hypothetical protein
MVRKKRKCGNCRVPGHTRNNCPQPTQKKSTIKAGTKRKMDDINFLDIIE